MDIINIKDKNLGYALLLTYYISEYPTEILYSNSQEKQIYSSLQTKLNSPMERSRLRKSKDFRAVEKLLKSKPTYQDIKHKIFNAANHVILFLEGMKDNIDEFYDAVDYYYSLYNIWTSDDLYKINNLSQSEKMDSNGME